MSVTQKDLDEALKSMDITTALFGLDEAQEWLQQWVDHNHDETGLTTHILDNLKLCIPVVNKFVERNK